MPKSSVSNVRSKIRDIKYRTQSGLLDILQKYGIDKLRLADINAKNKHVYQKVVQDVNEQKLAKIKVKESAFNRHYMLHTHTLQPPIVSLVSPGIQHISEKEFLHGIKVRKVVPAFENTLKKLVSDNAIKCWMSVHFTVAIPQEKTRANPGGLSPKGQVSSIGAFEMPDTEMRTGAVESSILTKTRDIKQYIIDSLTTCYRKLADTYQTKIISATKINLSVSKYTPRLGGSYVKLPKAIVDKRSCINIENKKDHLCFLYCVASALRLVTDGHPEMVRKYQWALKELKYKLSDFENGVDPSSSAILKFEKQNQLNINIYTCDDDGEKVTVLRISDQPFDTIVNMLLYKGHYTHMKNFQRFMGDGNRTCPRCLKTFHSKNKDAKRHFETHVSNCKDINKTNQQIKMPKKIEKLDEKGEVLDVIQPTIKFDGHRKQNRVPIVIYGDFEAINSKTHQKSGQTVKTTEHKPASYRFKIKSTFDLSSYDIPLEYSYVGEDANKHFVRTILDLEVKLQEALRKQAWKYKKNMIITADERREFECATDCHFCGNKIEGGGKLGEFPRIKVKDHCHYSGKYRGASCVNCNLQASIFSKSKEILGAKGEVIKKSTEYVRQSDIPFYFHNLNYDLRMIINAFTEIGEKLYEEYTDPKTGETKKKKIAINCIAENSEKYKCLSMKSYKFVDTMAFQLASLETLYKNVPENKKHAMKSITDDERKFKLIDKKGEFPYEWFDSLDKLDYKIPSWSCFKNKLTASNMSYSQYLTMLHTCREFDLTTFREFHDLYLQRDVYMLTDVFETFRDLSMESYGLDPAHFLGTPGLGWCAMLKKTGVVIDKLTDVDMYMFFEQGIRGGISKAVTRFFEANNEYCDNFVDDDIVFWATGEWRKSHTWIQGNFQVDDEILFWATGEWRKSHTWLPENIAQKSWLAYVDANNLYGKSMVSALPVGDFEWKDMTIDEVVNYAKQWSDNSGNGITVEVELEYPDHLHELHNENPLAPVKRCILKDEISEKTLYDLDACDITFSKVPKLVCDLHDKNNYVIHISALKFYLEQGHIIKKVHRCITYRQSKWLKSYIDFNTDKRAKSTEKYQKDFYKLMNNAVFGKSMENVRDRTTLRFALTEPDIKKWTNQPEFKGVIPGIGDENFRILNMKTREVELNKPIFVGQAILDLSKVHMYDFYYNVMKPKYGDNMQLVLTDTDSFVFAVKTEDWFADMSGMMQHFDTANFPEDHKLYSKDKENQLGLFKLEEMYMQKVVALKSKVYTYVLCDGKEKKTLKGVNRVSKEKDITFQNYKSCVMEGTQTSVSQNSIRSYKCQNYSITQQKRALCSYDDKRYQVDGIKTLAYGHKFLRV
jgi:hypothetical protein